MVALEFESVMKWNKVVACVVLFACRLDRSCQIHLSKLIVETTWYVSVCESTMLIVSVSVIASCV